MEATGIRLFGKKITCHDSRKFNNLPVFSTATATTTAREESCDCSHDEHGGCDNRHDLTTEEKTCLEEDITCRKHSEEDQPRDKKQEDGNPNTHITEDTDTTKTETEGDATNSQPDSLKKPDKILPCPRCNSMDTKFCYYNNYNIKQPRHFCKSCQRYWTAGGTMRSMPVGSGRRRNKNPASNCGFETISQHASFQAAQIEVANGVHIVRPKILSFGLDFPHVENAISCRDKENGDDCSSGSTVTTSNSVAEKTHDRNGFHPHVPCIPGVSWSYNPWNSAIPIPSVCPTGYSPMTMPIYPSPYWNYIPWLPVSSPAQNQNALGKHSRDRELKESNGCKEPKKQKNSVLIPKTLRIDDPDEAAKSSIWSTLGIKNENISSRGLFKAFQTKGEEINKHPVLQANPAALSRSLCFQERA